MEETATQRVIQNLGLSLIAVATNSTPKEVERWADGVTPDIDKLETLVFLADVVDKLIPVLGVDGTNEWLLYSSLENINISPIHAIGQGLRYPVLKLVRKIIEQDNNDL